VGRNDLFCRVGIDLRAALSLEELAEDEASGGVGHDSSVGGGGGEH